MNIKNILLAILILSTNFMHLRAISINSIMKIANKGALTLFCNDEQTLHPAKIAAWSIIITVGACCDIYLHRDKNSTIAKASNESYKLQIENKQLKAQVSQLSQLSHDNAITHIGGGIVVAPVFFEQIKAIKAIANINETEKQPLLICNGNNKQSENVALYSDGVILPNNRNLHLAQKYNNAINKVDSKAAETNNAE